MPTMQEAVFELKCASQNYHWGKVGKTSEVASLLSSGDSSFVVDDQTRYAELWMGTHPNAPSLIVVQGKTSKALSEWVSENLDKLGNSVKETFAGSLPFLFKVLSVDKSLSIQAHPNKRHAEELHKKDPKNYKDPNHKPEMAIALTDFTGLCGFRPVSEIAKFVEEIPELRAVIGQENGDKMVSASQSQDSNLQEAALRSSFSTLMRQDKDLVQAELKKLVDRVKSIKNSGEDISGCVGDILLKLDKEFPGDVGGFSIYFLNVMRLRKGDSIFLEANLPHAYLSGDCMECMACSDNVVRAGLTPKFIDTETLIEMLNYNGKPAQDNIYQPTNLVENGCNVRKFKPPIQDFAVTEISVPAGLKSTTLPAMSSASIVICIEGAASLNNQSLTQSIQVQRGTVLFISANEEAALEVSSANGMLLYRAHAGC
ncbi:mannose-6-phosphate isomerase-like [Ruditapes philippinarum]|uniref:mannose-6-phosphate isomerase-like n=1 Tax=Ruditapes philippinarum TaxID=129788 RepID=UPI00295BC525|nr:mannose-6-phosphate isomerase-like [Ruditapes philippinarum]